MRRLVLFSLIALATMALAACGSSSGSAPTVEEYGAAVALTRDRVDFALERITKAGSREEFLTRMDDASETIADAGDNLEATGAAEDFEAEHEQLVSSLEQLSVDVKATADQARIPGYEDMLFQSVGVSFESWDEVNKALAGMAGKGIEVSILQRH